MFSGLIAYRGAVVALQPLSNGGATLRVRCEGVESEAPQLGDSIAIDGVCLTVTEIAGDLLAFDVVFETLARSTIGDRGAADAVNLEYALRLGDRIGGHFVYGHVDASARVLSRTSEAQGERIRIARPVALECAIVEKAFVAVDGVSLTVAAAAADWFEVAAIPETLRRTTLGARPAGSRVNLEADPIARYVAATVRAGGWV
ncbi:MAG TPA: riboflavin synthase [Candidatus Tumulicola sp.]